ncbi:NERD domain-containing protein [Virgibacillus halophilus]|uniref:NERD domain-containing protein n=1 Tax=Tigheibacillus halophilus TaxID=361280 RepID=A0ABU5CCG9_9BACI|nr:NERD domain-containing protein [Virgibacillus halophilus]
MAQLIKLRDYISRYEWNMYRYPSQFIRLKQENWKKLNQAWEEQSDLSVAKEESVPDKDMLFTKLKSLLKRSSNLSVEDGQNRPPRLLPAKREDLKHYFLDKLYPSQLNWATSTVSDISFIAQKYYRDTQLKYFLQRFPDTYLLLYYPIFSIKNTPVDGEIILISPLGMEIIYLFADGAAENIIAEEGRTWTLHDKGDTISVLNPFIALRRTEKIIKSIIHQKEIDFPVQKTVLAPDTPIYFQKRTVPIPDYRVQTVSRLVWRQTCVSIPIEKPAAAGCRGGIKLL